MRKVVSVLIGVCMMQFVAQCRPYTAQAAELTRLANGLQVLVEEDHRFPLTAMRLYVHAGSAYETAEEAGISHILEHMVFKGTETRGPGEMAQAIEGVGGSLNAGTSFDQTMYKVDVPAEHWELGLSVLQDMAFGLQIDPEQLEQEKAVILAELERNEDNPDRLLFQELQPLVWPETSYARPIIGFRETVRNITAADIQAYTQRLYQPQSMLLVVCGHVETEAVLDKAEALFGKAANDRRYAPPQPWELDECCQDPLVTTGHGPWKKVYVSIGLPTPGFRAEEEAGLEVLAQLLGGDQTSLLYRTFKYEQQLVDEIAVAPVLLERGGMLYIRAQLDPDKLEPFWAELTTTLSHLSADQFSKQELDRAKLNLEDDLFQAKETLGGLASKLGHFQFYGSGPEEEHAYLFQLRHVDKGLLQKLLDAYVNPARMRSHVLLPDEVPLDGQDLAALVRQHWDKEKKTAESARAGGTKDLPDGRQIIEYGQGNRLVLLPDATLPYTAVTVTWPGGDAMLQQEQAGLAALAARALTRGTQQFDMAQFHEFLGDRAASVGARAGRQEFTLQTKFPTKFSEAMLEVVGDVITEPAWREEEIQRAQQDQVASIVEQQDQSLGLMSREMFPFLFTTFPYNTYHLGTREQVQQYRPHELRAYWQRQSAQPWIMTVCGRYDPEAVKQLASRLAQTPVRQTQAIAGDLVWSEKQDLELVMEDRNQAHLLVVFPVPGIAEDDHAGLSLLRKALAGQGGILFRELRDKQGLGYSVTSLLWQVQQGGFLGFYIGTDPDKRDQALQGFREIVRELRTTPLPEAELKRAQNLLQGDYYRSHQSLMSRSGEAADMLVQGLPVDFQQNRIEAAQRISGPELRDVARRFLDWDGAYTITVLPE